MFSNRLVSFILMILLVLCRTVAAETAGSDKFRALLDTGESVVLKSARLTSDSLIGTSGYGARSIPVQTIRSLDRSAGNYANTGALIGSALGAATALVIHVTIDPGSMDFGSAKEDGNNVAPELFAYTFGGGLVGIVVGLCFRRWESVPVSGSVSHIPERGEVRFQLSLPI